MSWNYRVIESETPHPKGIDLLYEIYEVYYAEDGAIEGWTKCKVSPCGSDLDELQCDIVYFQEALSRPVLKVKTLSNGDKVLIEASNPKKNLRPHALQPSGLSTQS